MAIFEKDKKGSFAFVENNNIEDNESFKKFVKAAESKNTTKNSSGRPNVNEEDKKNQVVMVYLTKEQKTLLQQKAKESGLSISKYITIKVFGLI